MLKSVLKDKDWNKSLVPMALQRRQMTMAIGCYFSATPMAYASETHISFTKPFTRKHGDHLMVLPKTKLTTYASIIDGDQVLWTLGYIVELILAQITIC